MTDKPRVSRARVMCTLFTSMFRISAFTFGGGFVIVTLMRRRFYEQLNWISEQEMLDMTALAQSAPGAIAVNAAVILGYRVGGYMGVLAASLGTILPPMITLGAISLVYEAFREQALVLIALEGMRAGVAAVLADVIWRLGAGVVKGKNALSICIMIAAFALTLVPGLNVAYIILIAFVAGVIKALTRRREGRA